MQLARSPYALRRRQQLVLRCLHTNVRGGIPDMLRYQKMTVLTGWGIRVAISFQVPYCMRLKSTVNLVLLFICNQGLTTKVQWLCSWCYESERVDGLLCCSKRFTAAFKPPEHSISFRNRVSPLTVSQRHRADQVTCAELRS